MKVIKYGLAVLFGIAIALTVVAIYGGCLDYQINIIDTLMLVVTTALTIAVVYLGHSLNKKNTACDIITKDLMELCEVYSRNILIIEKLSKQEISIADANTDIRMTFHRGDVIAEMITKEINESFPDFLKDKSEIQNLTTSYWKWLTDGDMQEADFQISQSFMKAHETEYRKTISNIKMIVHRLIKSV